MESIKEETTDEMFRKIGYEKKIDIVENDYLITTEYKKEDKYEIIFKIITKEVVLGGFRGIELEELQAINKKCQELGWI